MAVWCSRNTSGIGTGVVGDPCIVWDATLPGWRMTLFCDPPGHAHAICRSAEDIGPGHWHWVGPLEFTDPIPAHATFTHKPYIVQEAGRPNRAAMIDGRFMLVSVGVLPGTKRKLIHRAWASRLAGPWTWDAQPLIPPGDGDAFDGKHTDAVTGLYFPERREVVYFYMGYPQTSQDRTIGPFGSAQGVAVERIGEGVARKLGVILPPQQTPGHWASGWVGGLQVLPGKSHCWIGLANASPTAPQPQTDQTVARGTGPEPGRICRLR